MMVERIQRKRQTEIPENTRFVPRRSKFSLIEVGFDMSHYLTELVVLLGFWHSRRSTGKLFVFDATPYHSQNSGLWTRYSFSLNLCWKRWKWWVGKTCQRPKQILTANICVLIKTLAFLDMNGWKDPAKVINRETWKYTLCTLKE